MSVFRRATERLSRHLIFPRRLPKQFGRSSLWVSPDAALAWLKPGNKCFDSGLLAIAEEFVVAGSTVWDIGANVGLFAFAAAHQASKVVCVEPDLFLCRLINRSIRANPKLTGKIELLAAAISDKAGVCTFNVAARGRASNAIDGGLARSQAGGTRQRVLVPSLTADMLLEKLGAPDLIKIDVEGAEHLLLKGATRLLNDARPTIYIEVGEEQNADVTRTFIEANYVLLDPLLPKNERKPLTASLFNTLAVPAERYKI